MTTENHSGNNSKADYELPPWQKYLLIIALAIGLIGLSLQSVAYFLKSNAPTTATESTSSMSATHNSDRPTLGASSHGSETSEDDDGFFGVKMTDWSGLLTKVGFSLFVGFCIGYALRIFLKITALVVGVLLLVLFGLQYVELITVNWANFEGYYNSFIAWLQPQVTTFQEFITSNLPSAGMAATGLLLGLKKK